MALQCIFPVRNQPCLKFRGGKVDANRNTLGVNALIYNFAQWLFGLVQRAAVQIIYNKNRMARPFIFQRFPQALSNFLDQRCTGFPVARCFFAGLACWLVFHRRLAVKTAIRSEMFFQKRDQSPDLSLPAAGKQPDYQGQPPTSGSPTLYKSPNSQPSFIFASSIS